MSITLNRELEKLDADIRQAVLDGEEFHFAKLERSKAELLQKMFFAESRQLKSDIETLTASRAAAVSERESLTDELKQAADEVFSARSVVYDLEEAHSRIANLIYFLDQKAEIDRQSIKDLSKRLQTHINSKLQSGETTNE